MMKIHQARGGMPGGRMPDMGGQGGGVGTSGPTVDEVD